MRRTSFEMTRRDFLRVTGSTICGMSVFGSFPFGLGPLTQAAPAKTSGLKPVILCWLEGGPTGFDTFLPFEPRVPEELRGPLKSIPTRTPGLHFTELFPGLALRSDKFALIRTLQSGSTEHVAATGNHLKGKERQTLGQRWGERAAFGGVPYSLIDVPGAFRPDPPHEKNAAFYCVWKRAPDWEEAVQSAGTDLTGMNEYEKDLVGPGMFSPPDVQVDPRLAARRELLGQLEGRDGVYGPQAVKFEKNKELAFELLLGGGKFFEAFSARPSEREQHEKDLVRYGRESRVGQALLLARRMVERGAGFVTVHNGLRGGWDMHGELYKRLPPLAAELDCGISALVDDISAGVVDCTLVVMGEFGRTPRINTTGGRDHWDDVNFAILAGGHFLPGVFHGSITNQGSVKDGKVDAEVFARTLIHGAGGEELLVPNETRVREVLR